MTPEERFWTKVDQTDACWLWTAALTHDGYAQFTAGGRKVYAHRFAYALLVAPIPDGLYVDHLCWVRHCVNPAHMRLVTHRANLQNREGATARSKTGVRGVQWHERAQKYVVQVNSGGVFHHGGLHETLEAAEAAAIALRCRVMTHNEADRRVG